MADAGQSVLKSGTDKPLQMGGSQGTGGSRGGLSGDLRTVRLLLFAAIGVSRRVLNFSLIGQSLHIVPVLIAGDLIALAVRLLAGDELPPLTHFIGSLIGALMWIPMSVLFRLPRLPKVNVDRV